MSDPLAILELLTDSELQRINPASADMGGRPSTKLSAGQACPLSQAADGLNPQRFPESFHLFDTFRSVREAARVPLGTMNLKNGFATRNSMRTFYKHWDVGKITRISLKHRVAEILAARQA